MSQVRNAVREFVLQNFLQGEDPRNLTDDTELKESGILDSLSTLRLVSFLEESFGIELDAADLTPSNLSTLQSIEAMVKGKLPS
jgi:acyl carrier protein